MHLACKLANQIVARLIFVTLTNILLITSLISLLSNSLTEVGPYYAWKTSSATAFGVVGAWQLKSHCRADSFFQVMAHARDEYLFQYSIYVLESSSTSSRLTYFFPPLVSALTMGSAAEQR